MLPLFFPSMFSFLWPATQESRSLNRSWQLLGYEKKCQTAKTVTHTKPHRVKSSSTSSSSTFLPVLVFPVVQAAWLLPLDMHENPQLWIALSHWSPRHISPSQPSAFSRKLILKKESYNIVIQNSRQAHQNFFYLWNTLRNLFCKRSTYLIPFFTGKC